MDDVGKAILQGHAEFLDPAMLVLSDLDLWIQRRVDKPH